jgi:CheY-like chemotaxis protein
MLLQLGYKVLDADDGTTAIRRFEQLAGSIDLLVTDVVMPEISGPQLVDRLRSTGGKLKVLYLSGYAEDAILRHGAPQADQALLQKPFNIQALAAKVRQALDGPQAR